MFRQQMISLPVFDLGDNGTSALVVQRCTSLFSTTVMIGRKGKAYVGCT